MQTYNVTVDEDKNIRWYNDKGQLHRLDGPAVEYADGDKAWYVNDKLHRLEGPAVECADGYKSWWVKGKRHRLDGPAIEYVGGRKEWWIDDKELTEKEFNAYIKPTCEGKIVEVDGIKYKLVKA
jgi:hypothetical protein